MPRKSIAPQSRRHIWVFDEDWEYIEKRFGKFSPSAIGTSAAIRRMIQVWVGNMRKQEQERIEQQRGIALLARKEKSDD